MGRKRVKKPQKYHFFDPFSDPLFSDNFQYLNFGHCFVRLLTITVKTLKKGGPKSAKKHQKNHLF